MSLETINLEHLKLNTNDKLLDLGCGEGRHALSAYIAREVEVYAVDLSIKDLGITKSRFNEFNENENKQKTLSLAAADAKNLPFQDDEFDSVICSEVLEHIHDYKSVLSEISRVLKNGGVAGISVPRFFPEWICWQLSDAYHEVKGGHVRIFKNAVFSRISRIQDSASKNSITLTRSTFLIGGSNACFGENLVREKQYWLGYTIDF